MRDSFIALAVHQAKVHKTFLDAWGTGVPEDRLGVVVDTLVHHGLWLTKFPLLAAPTFGILRLDALDKARQGLNPGPGLGAEAAALVPLVDADVLRFILSLDAKALEGRVEIFYGGRALNKPLWNYLLAWFDRAAVLRAWWGNPPGLLDTVFV